MGQDILGIVNTYYDGFEKVSSDLAQVQLKERDWEVFLDNSGFALKEVEETETDSKINSKIIKVRGTLTDLFDTGLGMNENKHSAWNAYNAVTEFVDHYRSSRKTSAYGSINEARLDSQWFGSGARLKQQAWDAATGLLLVA
jgi:hypothetical protein